MPCSGFRPRGSGLAYHFSGTKRLVELIGPMRTKELLFTARRYSAAEALAMGMITQVVPHDQLENAARMLAASIAGNAPLSVRATKAMVNEAVKDSAERDMSVCERVSEECRKSQDHAEGRKAFMEKRQPRFVGM